MQESIGKLRFFDSMEIDKALSILQLKKDGKVKCTVCDRKISKDEIGAFKSGSVEPICNDFSCIMTALLEEKLER